jgi:hypothetical protein
MSATFRETTIRVAGVDRVIRTELSGKIRNVKQLEAAHTKDVKAAIIDMRIAASPDSMPREMADRLARRATQFPACNYVAARKGFPKATSTSDVPEYLVKVGEDEYATTEAAESMGASERVDEILPGLTLRRYGKGWALFHLASADDKHPHGFNLGPVFKTQKRAREVALTELAGLDFTRSGEALVADEETSAVVKFVKLREFVAASKQNAWAEDELRQAEKAVSALAVGDAA